MYAQITQEERYRIAEMRRLRLSIRAIAAELGREPMAHRRLRAVERYRRGRFRK